MKEKPNCPIVEVNPVERIFDCLPFPVAHQLRKIHNSIQPFTLQEDGQTILFTALLDDIYEIIGVS